MKKKLLAYALFSSSFARGDVLTLNSDEIQGFSMYATDTYQNGNVKSFYIHTNNNKKIRIRAFRDTTNGLVINCLDMVKFAMQNDKSFTLDASYDEENTTYWLYPKSLCQLSR